MLGLASLPHRARDFKAVCVVSKIYLAAHSFVRHCLRGVGGGREGSGQPARMLRALHRRDWCPSTSLDEALRQFIPALYSYSHLYSHTDTLLGPGGFVAFFTSYSWLCNCFCMKEDFTMITEARAAVVASIITS